MFTIGATNEGNSQWNSQRRGETAAMQRKKGTHPSGI